MRARYPQIDTDLLAAHFQRAANIASFRTLAPSFEDLSSDTVNTILQEASRFAEHHLLELNEAMDRVGAKLEDGAVGTAPGHREAWAAYREGGWPSLDHSVEFGGQQLPLSLTLAVEEIFARCCPAFDMLPVPQRSAARLIETFADDAMKNALLPDLASGELGATICISEIGAGSDLRQLRTGAVLDGSGVWRVTGEKCWISYGHHDLTEKIVHCVLARSDQAGTTRPEISLFLVPSGASVHVRRIEHKLGLHGSPTCALGFESSPATLLGTRGQGLQHVFVMIGQMRLSVGAMGLGIAAGCLDAALAYSEERLQGGPPRMPVPISQHIDVQRQLFEMAARVEVLRGLVLTTANLSDIARLDNDAARRRDAAVLVKWLLPIVKTFGAEAAFDTASDAIQVFGGAGYTCDWPVEQALRDARVLAVFEGTSGMQALDLAHRRVLGEPDGLTEFLRLARAASSDSRVLSCLDLLEDSAARMRTMDPKSGDIDAGAYALLRLAILAAGSWIAGGFLSLPSHSPAVRRMHASAEYWLQVCPARARSWHAEVVQGRSRLHKFDAIRRSA